ncbi:unnamed protein product [Clonostachys rosea f. rosea IK726]|uniref:Uncharacterized protein n=1 Tax=Clonostachys rosea f. rosea IK726 TaxID=1349383 RepID=A0ACA9UFG7_BIOOC|nr:unnamed protein product [Clonostachys rosea f. rosea IK726]
MRFTKFFAGVTFALSATQASATVSPGEVAETFERLTNIASDIIQTVASLDSTKIITSVPVLVDAIDIVGNPDQFKDIGKSDQDKICDALENFVDKARDAVDSIIGKDSIIGRTPFVSIIANILSVAADALESLARSAVKIVPGCKERIEKKLDLLHNSFGQGVSNFRAKAIEQGGSPISIPTGIPTAVPTAALSSLIDLATKITPVASSLPTSLPKINLRAEAVEQDGSPISIPTGIPTSIPTAALSSLIDLATKITPVASSLPTSLPKINLRAEAVEQGDSPISIPTSIPTAALSFSIELATKITPVASSLPKITGGPIPVPFQA